MAKKGRDRQKPARNAAPLSDSRKIDRRKTDLAAQNGTHSQAERLTEISDRPLGKRLVTSKLNKRAGLEGALQDGCKPNEFKPGNRFRWKPGQSGNPSGLPSEAREVSTAVIKERLSRVNAKLNKSELEIIVDAMIRRAKQGSYKDKKLVLAYGLGMPKQIMELDAKFDFTDRLAKIRERQRQLPAATPTNGHSDAETVEQAETISEAPIAPEEQAEPQDRIKRVVV